MSAQREAVPVYETHRGWQCDTSSARTFSALPANAKRYLKRLTELVGAPITLLSVGSHEDQTLHLPVRQAGMRNKR